MNSRKRVAIIAGSILLVLIAAIFYVALWTGSTEEIESVADKFQPGESWTLTSENIRPPQYICIDGGTCPELSRTWESSEALTRDELEKMIQDAGWDFAVEGDCVISESASGSYSTCNSKGTIDNYKINIRYGSTDIRNIKPNLLLLITSLPEE